MKRIWLLGLLWLPAAAPAQSSLDETFARDVLVVAASSRTCYRFDIYLAVTPAQRARGLMFVREMPDTTGMLFVYEADDRLSFWMRNTYIPLDMVFARADGTVAFVAENTEPLSLASIVAPEPVRYTLELNAGVSARLRIDTGSRLLLVDLAGHDE